MPRNGNLALGMNWIQVCRWDFPSYISLNTASPVSGHSKQFCTALYVVLKRYVLMPEHSKTPEHWYFSEHTINRGGGRVGVGCGMGEKLGGRGERGKGTENGGTQMLYRSLFAVLLINMKMIISVVFGQLKYEGMLNYKYPIPITFSFWLLESITCNCVMGI